ncbi:unnamed protein product [Cyprideis torosa]|uniref:Uncharacterized protein n=1 Tax=Cyprideis torosa TaxID=163714 RepID=A0A7R8WDH2_9CRUS|nr:unnamed protein product [Cyprideis torosa]CAG0888568.1 unnamed protein product [Cyprideis torosa]
MLGFMMASETSAVLAALDLIAEHGIPRCAVCNHAFAISDCIAVRGKSIPHLLDCGHSICHSCRSDALLKTDLANRNFMCHVKDCGKTTPGDSVLPVDYWTIGRVCFLMKNASPGGRSTVKKPRGEYLTGDRFTSCGSKISSNAGLEATEPCSECDMTADHHCRKCDADYCNPCFDRIHNQSASKALAKHAPIPLKAISRRGIEIPSQFCSQHREVGSLKSFCEDCQVVVCHTCSGSEHSEHCLVSVAEKNSEARLELSKLEEELQRILIIAKRGEEITVVHLLSIVAVLQVHTS